MDGIGIDRKGRAGEFHAIASGVGGIGCRDGFAIICDMDVCTGDEFVLLGVNGVLKRRVGVLSGGLFCIDRICSCRDLCRIGGHSRLGFCRHLRASCKRKVARREDVLAVDSFEVEVACLAVDGLNARKNRIFFERVDVFFALLVERRYNLLHNYMIPV